MHVKEYDIITDFTRQHGIPCKDGIIAVCNNMSCKTCDEPADFEPLVSDGAGWFCMECWVDMGHEPPSEGTVTRLEEAKITTRANYLIRNM